MSSTDERPLAVGPIQDPKHGPRVVIAFANGTAVAFTPDQARQLALQIRTSASDAELGRHSGSVARVIEFMSAADGSRH